VLTALPVCDCSRNTCRVGIWCQKHKGVLRMHSSSSGVWTCAEPPALTFVHFLFFFFNPFMLL